ncbi:heterochromatin protein (macronuclear) [Tetrahymena thermophila SB210]|uniref:Heterochromatin protein n=1 Tax=Tetrahymena thermophila (strain SB210) TaxID=312017 RepID=I7LTB8_TETTS|nr:heterochromatin protein [Tetrahymena thermophila SB210]EAR84960.3 heterochromatin protein [Tetrahymena thermophila SB210]|eukprot:XP_001032623.3 heterochromatin protein [Tetrahymena thermophila SB210]
MEQQQTNLEYSPYIFEIESILEKRIHPKTGKTEFLVQWKQWPDDPTWEPAQNIQSFLNNNNQKKKEDDSHSNLKQRKLQKIEDKVKRSEQANNQTQKLNDSLQYLDEQIQFLQNKYELFISDSETEQKKLIPDKISEIEPEQIENEENTNMMNNVQIEPIYKILDKQEVENTIYYLILFYDEKLPQWVKQEKLIGYEDEILEYEKQIIQESTELNSKQLLETSIQSIQNENLQIEKDQKQEENQFKKVMDQENLEKSKNNFNRNQQFQNDIDEGDFLTDQIQDIEANFMFTYSINWKPRKDGNIPLNKQVQFVKKITITPQEFIDQILQNKFLN